MTRPRLNFFQIRNMCFGFFGIQIAFGLQNANASRIFQTLGANVDDLAILWIAAPATGLLVQPIIGYLSDRTWGPLGRRRPYFFFGAILTTLALLVMPNAPMLWVAAGALWLMDASINITMEPFRAFVGDQLPDEQRTSGYAMQSFFIGLGAVFASALPWILKNAFGIENVAPAGQISDSVRLAFYVGAGCLLLAVMWTVFTTREYSPEEMEAFEKERKKTGAENAAENASVRAKASYVVSGAIWTVCGAALAVFVFYSRLEKELYVLAGLIAAVGLAQIVASAMKAANAGANGFVEVIDDVFQMPKTMRQLAVVQFFSWVGLFAMWIYTTAAVTSFHYHTTDTSSELYNDGADWVGLLFAVYNGVAALAAIIIPSIAARIGRKGAHMLNLVLGGLGLLSFLFIKDPTLLWISMIGVGFAWASILSAPYSILAGVLPAKKMGVYMGIFNIFIVAPQLVAATLLAVLIKLLFGGEPIYALVIGAGSMFLAALAVLGVDDPGDPRRAGAIS